MAENKHFLVTIWKSPSLRGSGLKFLLQFLVSLFEQSPSLRGSGLKLPVQGRTASHAEVSLFTREWIEIESAPHSRYLTIQSPSLRGSGLKLLGFIWKKSKSSVSLFTREWIEICSNVPCFPGLCRVSLFTREWIEISS